MLGHLNFQSSLICSMGIIIFALPPSESCATEEVVDENPSYNHNPVTLRKSTPFISFMTFIIISSMCLYCSCVRCLSPPAPHKLSTGRNPEQCAIHTINSYLVVIIVFLLSHLKTYSFLPLQLCSSCSFTPKTPPPHLYDNLKVFLERPAQAPLLL